MTQEKHRGQVLRERVEEYLSENSKTKTQFADELGMSRRKLYNEFKSDKPSIATIIQIGQKIGHDFSGEIPELEFYANVLDEKAKEEAAEYKKKLIDCEQEKVELYQKIIELHNEIAKLRKQEGVQNQHKNYTQNG